MGLPDEELPDEDLQMDRHQGVVKYPGITSQIWGGAFSLERGFDHSHLLIKEICGPREVEIE